MSACLTARHLWPWLFLRAWPNARLSYVVGRLRSGAVAQCKCSRTSRYRSARGWHASSPMSHGPWPCSVAVEADGRSEKQNDGFGREAQRTEKAKPFGGQFLKFNFPSPSFLENLASENGLSLGFLHVFRSLESPVSFLPLIVRPQFILDLRLPSTPDCGPGDAADFRKEAPVYSGFAATLYT